MITCTLDDEHMPENQSLDKTHGQKFLKRLRKQRGPFRYYWCGEYGDTTKRAHYHALLFGMDFPDKVQFFKKGDNTLYVSDELNKLWGMGHCSIAPLTFETAAYCARYALKKKLSENKNRLSYFSLETTTGELIPVQHPYATMSLKPAIGKAWFEKFHADIYGADKDFLVLRGQRMKPAKYFDKLLDEIDPVRMERIKARRKEERKERTPQELRAHAQIARARMGKRCGI